MKSVIIVTATAFLLTACTTNPYTGETQLAKTSIGAGGGAAVGALAGALIGKGKRKNILIGAGVGALAGGSVGAYMDYQEAKLRQRLQATGVSVTRQGNNIILNMPSNVTFASAQDQINPNFNETLGSVALVLNEYNQTLVDVDGYTDSDGSDQYNYDLSQRRASSVASFLQSRQVDGRRLQTRGFGESKPIASNATAQGKAQNRRVEIIIQPLTNS